MRQVFEQQQVRIEARQPVPGTLAVRREDDAQIFGDGGEDLGPLRGVTAGPVT